MLALLLLLFAQFAVPTHSGALAAAPAGCGSLPVSDNFAGSGSLSGCWTQTSASGFVPLVRSSGLVIPNTASSQGLATFTGVSFTSNQSAQAALVWSAGNYSGVGINVTSAGDGAFYFPSLGSIYAVVGGSGTGNILTCGVSTSGDVVKLAISSGIYTVTDITTSTTLCSGTGAISTTGTPAILVDRRGGGSDSITNFEAD